MQNQRYSVHLSTIVSIFSFQVKKTSFIQYCKNETFTYRNIRLIEDDGPTAEKVPRLSMPDEQHLHDGTVVLQEASHSNVVGFPCSSKSAT